MNEFIKLELEEASSTMQKALAHTDSEFTKIRAGKA
jgi:ribosome recycling factor